MTMVSTLTTPRTEGDASSQRLVYEPPCLAWEEDFEPAGQITGCADNGDLCPERPEFV